MLRYRIARFSATAFESAYHDATTVHRRRQRFSFERRLLLLVTAA